jgi:hypothetical protein
MYIDAVLFYADSYTAIESVNYVGVRPHFRCSAMSDIGRGWMTCICCLTTYVLFDSIRGINQGLDLRLARSVNLRATIARCYEWFVPPDHRLTLKWSVHTARLG